MRRCDFVQSGEFQALMACAEPATSIVKVLRWTPIDHGSIGTSYYYRCQGHPLILVHEIVAIEEE